LRQSPPCSALGSVGFENQRDANGDWFIWLDHAALAKLKALRGPGESYSEGCWNWQANSARNAAQAPIGVARSSNFHGDRKSPYGEIA
jgi:hypothetical protein